MFWPETHQAMSLNLKSSTASKYNTSNNTITNTPICLAFNINKHEKYPLDCYYADKSFKPQDLNNSGDKANHNIDIKERETTIIDY